MGKLIVQEMISLDGYLAGTGGEIDWHRPDEQYSEYAAAFLRSVDTLLFGKVTYELMAGHWPNATGEIAKEMNEHAKIVFSSTLHSVDWQNTKLIGGNVAEEVARLRSEPGRTLAVLGSATLAASLGQAGLVDEYQLTVVPVALGAGKPLFAIGANRADLELLEAKPYSSGNVLLRYRPAHT